MEKIIKHKLKKYEKEIDRLMDKNGGELTADHIVEAARSNKNPLHCYFTWNDNEEAHLWRLHKARMLFGYVVQQINVKGDINKKVFRKYIQVINSNKLSVYVPTKVAIKTKNYASQIVADCITLSNALTCKLQLFQNEIL